MPMPFNQRKLSKDLDFYIREMRGEEPELREILEHYKEDILPTPNIPAFVNKVMVKIIKSSFKVGDIVFLNPQIEFVNWTLKKWLDKPFIIVQLPVDTQKFKTYTLRLLDDSSNQECWEDLAFHESFLEKRT
jgi:hypothetical protein